MNEAVTAGEAASAAGPQGAPMAGVDEHPIPEATIARLPVYLRALVELDAQGIERVSSTRLAEAAGVQSAQLRRDLSCFGSYGTRGVGYQVRVLIREIGERAGSGTAWPVVVVGVGNMGRALARHLRSLDRDFRLVALVDTDPAVVGTLVAGVRVEAQHELAGVVAGSGARIAVITTPAGAAQQSVDQLAGAGITSILNFAPAPVVAPPGVTVRAVDLAQELHILAFHEARRVADQAPATATPGQAEDLQEFAQ